MQRSRMMLGLAVAAMAALTLSATQAEDAKDGEKAEVKVVCPVSGKPINKQHSVDYKKGEVYFCCPNCPKAFAKNPKKFATKANLQLVQTEQYVQKACPISGRKLNPAQSLTIKGVEVGFCCPNCKGKVAGLEGEKQVAAVVAEKPFKKAFKPAKKDDPA